MSDIDGLVLLQLARIYDMLFIVAQSLDPAAALKMTEAHKQGFIVGPPLALRIDEENE